MLMNELDADNRFTGVSLLRNHPEEPTNGRHGIVHSSMALAQIVRLMLQSPNHRHFSLSDLEWMVLPALSLGQLAMAETKPDQSGMRQPLAVLFWAAVSPEIDKRMSAQLEAPIRLRPDEWKSGDILWITDMIGDLNTGHTLVKSVLESVLAGCTVKVRSMDGGGKRILLQVNASSVSVVARSEPDTCGHSGSCPPNGILCASCIHTGCTGRCRQGKANGVTSANH